LWDSQRLFEVESAAGEEKYFATFPYPYMNGRAHLGHTFTFTKVEFAAGFERLKGKRVLFPFGLHCTGMPIKVCADKLKKEVAMFGHDFSGYKPEVEEVATKLEAMDVDVIVKKKHSKAAAKAPSLKYQFQIMQTLGIPLEEIASFADANKWMDYFPPLWLKDVRALGCKVDYRRSFITTARNSYYDSFVRWQFNLLRKLGKIQFGERYTIYSVVDGQPCMDHDRQVGEGVGPQEYTGIKLKVVEWSPACKEQGLDTLTQTKCVYLLAATLRPETMYGQTNCFVGVNLKYGVFETNKDGEYFVCTERAAKNMCWQGFTKEKGKYVQVATVTGKDLLGVKVHAPLSQYEQVYVLPMENVLENKGTGVVTSVPSDSPDDYATITDLAKKTAYYGIQPEWIVPFTPVPIIRTQLYGDLAAPTVCQQKKINSQKDRALLKEAKEIVYKEGFYNGVMLAGDFAGLAVQDAKQKIRDVLIHQNEAIVYYEPEGLVVSRSGDECIVNLCDQWYLDYGEDEWRRVTEQALANMNTYGVETRHQFEKTLAWLKQWACARTFGLGSQLPWDTQYLVESLSDSTIYMAYYTIAHLLQGGSLDGRVVGPLGITPDQMTDSVWEYILRDGPYPDTSTIEPAKLDQLKGEFAYFYPLDLRVSGKDLVPNHLTFWMYNHTAIFKPEHWPRGVRANGHLLLNSEKMSKSTGNFMTLSEAVRKYGADATRLALADAGDGLEDANFEETTANSAILRLFTLMEWAKEVLAGEGTLRTGPCDSFYDQVFESEMLSLMRQAEDAYKHMLFREALKFGCYEFQGARDRYRDAVQAEGKAMHRDLVAQWLEWQVLILAPITPHWSEHVWMDVLKKPSSVLLARWPESTKEVDNAILAAAQYVRDTLRRVRELEMAVQKKKKGKAAPASEFNAQAPKALTIVVAAQFPAWQDASIAILKRVYEENGNTFNDAAIKQALIAAGMLKDKRVMPFVQEIKASALYAYHVFVETRGKVWCQRL
jgi:leucyl-tRNA synthetase